MRSLKGLKAISRDALAENTVMLAMYRSLGLEESLTRSNTTSATSGWV